MSQSLDNDVFAAFGLEPDDDDRPKQARARRATAGCDPISILESIANDPYAPAAARIAACRELLRAAKADDGRQLSFFGPGRNRR